MTLNMCPCDFGFFLAPTPLCWAVSPKRYEYVPFRGRLGTKGDLLKVLSQWQKLYP